MKRPHFHYFFCLFFLSYILPLHSQESYFAELAADKTFGLKNEFKINLQGDFKFQLNDNNHWRKPSLILSTSKSFNSFWTIQAGITNSYTIQNNFNNFYEFRPWIGPSLSVPIIKRISLQQRFRYELRNLLYTKDHSKNQTQSRYRYRIHLNIKLSKNLDRKDIWSINTGYEWYFIKEPATGEQFSNSRELSIRLQKVFPNSTYLQFTYLFEKINVYRNPSASNGNTFSLSYSF